MIRNVVFDLGRVLVEYTPELYIRKYVSDDGDVAIINREMFHAPEWLDNDRGSITSDQFLQAVCKRIPQRLHAEVKKIWENWQNFLVPIPETNALAKNLKERGYHVFLLSNMSEKYYGIRHIIPALPYLDGEFISADVHQVKPDEEIFQTFLKRYGLKSQECFFIDDRAENIAGAEKTGMKGFCFRHNVAELKKTLKGAGVEV
ncbi:MAG TPA: HAD family phosphatase [Caproiciproducens sp.]|nr:HAD family phosphatase [Caproiciproducens sp.]